MNKLATKLYKFMYNRYGIDDLYKLCLKIYIILFIINIFLNSDILSIIELLLFIIIIYRSMSKNKYKRRKENEKFLELKKKIINKYNNLKRKYQDRNTHMYKKCPKCKKTLRLPLKKGEHTVKCPNCNRRFKVKCMKNEKIKVEVIKNK